MESKPAFDPKLYFKPNTIATTYRGRGVRRGGDGEGMEQENDDRLEEEDFGAILRTLGPLDLLQPAQRACSLPCQRAVALLSAAANQRLLGPWDSSTQRCISQPPASLQTCKPFCSPSSRASSGLRCRALPANPRTAPTPCCELLLHVLRRRERAVTARFLRRPRLAAGPGCKCRTEGFLPPLEGERGCV